MISGCDRDGANQQDNLAIVMTGKGKLPKPLRNSVQNVEDGRQMEEGAEMIRTIMTALVLASVPAGAVWADNFPIIVDDIKAALTGTEPIGC